MVLTRKVAEYPAEYVEQYGHHVVRYYPSGKAHCLPVTEWQQYIALFKGPSQTLKAKDSCNYSMMSGIRRIQSGRCCCPDLRCTRKWLSFAWRKTANIETPPTSHIQHAKKLFKMTIKLPEGLQADHSQTTPGRAGVFHRNQLYRSMCYCLNFRHKTVHWCKCYYVIRWPKIFKIYSEYLLTTSMNIFCPCHM